MKIGEFAVIATEALAAGESEFHIRVNAGDCPKDADTGDIVLVPFLGVGTIVGRTLGFVQGQPTIAINAIRFLNKYTAALKEAGET